VSTLRMPHLKKIRRQPMGLTMKEKKAVSKEGKPYLMEIGYGKKESIFL